MNCPNCRKRFNKQDFLNWDMINCPKCRVEIFYYNNKLYDNRDYDHIPDYKLEKVLANNNM
jgi:DNA-directed RNA polymerase subunit RPC12/RpoP